MANIIYNELKMRGYNVDVVVVQYCNYESQITAVN